VKKPKKEKKTLGNQCKGKTLSRRLHTKSGRWRGEE
jgi:hypothetical protein